MQWYLVGTVAALLTTFGFVPQIVKMVKTGSVKDISLVTLVQFSVGVTLWTLYGFHQSDAVIIGANAVSLLIFVVAIVVYYWLKRHSKSDESCLPRS